MQVAVLGLGRFGSSVAAELTRLGHEVLAVDQNERAVRDNMDHVTHCAQADITDAEALEDLGISQFDAVIVAVAADLEASILCTVTLKQLGVRKVIAKAGTNIHGNILERLGATRVVLPEYESGLRLAHSFRAAGVRDYLDVAPGYGVARVQTPTSWTSKTLGEIDLVRNHELTPLALHRKDKVVLNPPASEVLRDGDELIVAGLDEHLAKLPGPDGAPS